MFRRDDAASTVETPSITSGTEASDSFPSTYTSQTDTRSGENVSTLLPPSISSVDTTSNPGYTITPSRTSIPSSTGRQLVVVETSTPPESHSFSTSTLGPSTAATTTLSDTVTSSTLLDTTSATTEGSISADIPSSTMLFYSIVTAANPIPTVAPASSISPSRTSVYSILPVSDSTTMSTSSPSLTSIYSILPVSDTTTISTPPPSSPSLTSIYSILPVSESTISSTPEVAPESQSSTLVYSILPVSDSTSTSESPTLAYSILPVALDTSTPTVVPVSTTSTLVYSIFPVSTSTTTTIISPEVVQVVKIFFSFFPNTLVHLLYLICFISIF
ncbi:hypothetical protein DFS33DRAFT_554537 [Desarmillaria ectypa]|nr:hypothetical protein DFS33DRAFT_554537 [Desarmillaria ectypa]